MGATGVLLFSGGIDSTVLGADILANPEVYDIDHLHLLSVGPTEESIKGWFNIQYKNVSFETVIPDNLKGVEGAYVFGTSIHPLVDQDEDQLDGLPYTPGLHAYMFSIAYNKRMDFDGELCILFGFQWDKPIWRAHDSGKLVPNDTSPEFIAALDAVCKASGDGVRVRAPFLETRMDKRRIVLRGKKLKVPFLLTESCVYHKGCGVCHQCIARAQALKWAGLEEAV